MIVSVVTCSCDKIAASMSTCVLSFLFFKQKTAYEWRISDWSSDVCSSDLPGNSLVSFSITGPAAPLPASQPIRKAAPSKSCSSRSTYRSMMSTLSDPAVPSSQSPSDAIRPSFWMSAPRSEEHTSELQSLMRNTYAVFCLQKHQQCCEK